MKQLLDTLTGSVHLFGYTMPVMVLAAAGLVLFAILARTTWPVVIAVLLLLIYYYFPPSY